MEAQYRITVFTPTYNRAYILENLYRSLQRQSFRDFEWLVVDDGSGDDTDRLVAGWMAEENPFPIRYVRQENGGKCFPSAMSARKTAASAGPSTMG